MQAFYRAILGLYPAKYRAAFAPEMIEVFDQASIDSRKRGLLRALSFAGCEFAGLVKGLFLEHASKWAQQDAYLTSRCTAPRNAELPAELVDIQRRLDRLLRSMEFAIAHHDFPKARFYSNEERITRALFERLVSEHKPDTLWDLNECA